jgi:hypothetical protein
VRQSSAAFGANDAEESERAAPLQWTKVTNAATLTNGWWSIFINGPLSGNVFLPPPGSVVIRSGSMPASIIGELVGEVVKGVFEVGCYFVGHAIAPVVSFGRWKCDRITADVPRQKLRKGGLYHLRGEQVYLTADATMLLGFAFILLLVGAGILIW